MNTKINLNLFGERVCSAIGESVCSASGEIEMYFLYWQGFPKTKPYYVNGFYWNVDCVWLLNEKVSADKFSDALQVASNYQIKCVKANGEVDFSPIEHSSIVVSNRQFYGIVVPFVVHSYLMDDGTYAEPLIEEIVLTPNSGPIVTDKEGKNCTANYTLELVEIE